MDEITKIETIDQYDQLFGLETLHPLVNVIDFSKATKTEIFGKEFPERFINVGIAEQNMIGMAAGLVR